MQRVLAVLGAVVMVVAALAVRSLIDGDDDGGGGGNGRDGPVQLLCAEELADVCEALADEGLAEVEVEAVGDTVDRLADPEADLDADGWLTLDPFSAVVDELRAFATAPALFDGAQATDRSTGLALVAADGERADALGSACPTVGWACLGDLAGDPWDDHGGQAGWGTVGVGYERPDTSATGLLVITQAMADHLGDPGFAGNDIDERWLADLDDAVPNRGGGDPLATMVLQGGAAFSAVGSLGLTAEAAQAAARGEDLVIFYPDPMYRASVVLAPGRGRDLGDLVDDDELTAALDDAGWDRGETGEPLPPAGVLVAMRTAWEDV